MSHMVIKFEDFLNESNNTNPLITEENLEQMAPRIKAAIAGNEDLNKGLTFCLKSLGDDDDFMQEMIGSYLTKLNAFLKTNPLFVSKMNDELDRGYSGNKSTGKNYSRTADLSVVEVTKMIKAELKSTYPEIKFSASSEKYSGGQSINVKVVDIPFSPFSDELDAHLSKGMARNDYKTNYGWGHDGGEVFNDQYKTMIKKIENIVNQYNYDDSDSQVDYFSTRYYTHVGLKNEYSIIKKFYPNNESNNALIAREEEWDAKQKARNDEKRKIKAMITFKKGDEVWYNYTRTNSPHIPPMMYKAKIVKAPNGQGMFSNYDIEFYVTHKTVNGTVVEMNRPSTYRTKCWELSGEHQNIPILLKRDSETPPVV